MTQIFPKWMNMIPKIIVVGIIFIVLILSLVIWYFFSPWHTDVGYTPTQPIPYSHKLHAGDLNIDCRYCHFNVERSAIAGVPPTQVCMNCHETILSDSKDLKYLMESWNNNIPIEWIKVHKLPDYAYFDHSVHVKAGVGCYSCHGRVDQMEEVRQEKPLSMGWCLDCHRSTTKEIRPFNSITNMQWQPSIEWNQIAEQKAKLMTPPVESCSGCHR